MSGSRLATDFKGRIDTAAVADIIIGRMQAAGEGKSGEELMRLLVAELVQAIGDALGPAVVDEVRQATLTVAEGGLQSYVVPPGGAGPTGPPLVPAPMDGVLS